MKWTELGWVCRQRQTARWNFFRETFHCGCLKKRQSDRKRKNGQVPTLKQKETGNCVKVQAIVVGPVTTRVVIALWDLICEVHSLRWVVGLSFRLSAAIPKSSFLSEVHNHPFEPGELKKIGKLCGEMSFKKKRLVNDCVFFRKLLVEQCRILEPIAADQAL